MPFPPAWAHIGCQRILRSLVEAPCLACGAEGGDPLCTACSSRLDPLPRAHCRRCLGSLDALGTCGLCRRGPLPFESVTALGRYSGALKKVIRALKYAARADLGLYLGERLARELTVADRRPRLVVPLPVHAHRRRERGYNQVEPIAWQLARSLGLPYDPRALRRSGTSSPFYAEGRDRRWQLAHAAFHADPGRLKGRHVLIVDDIMTSGATLWAAGRTLREQGAASLRVAVVARTSLRESAVDRRDRENCDGKSLGLVPGAANHHDTFR